MKITSILQANVLDETILHRSYRHSRLSLAKIVSPREVLSALETKETRCRPTDDQLRPASLSVWF